MTLPFRLSLTLLMAALLSAPAFAQTTIDFWTVGDSSGVAPLETIIAAFNETHPDVQVNFQIFSGDQYTNALNLAFRGGDAPDVLRSGALAIPFPTMVANGWLEPLESFDSAELLGRVPDELLLEGTVRVGGELYSLPIAQAGGTANYRAT